MSPHTLHDLSCPASDRSCGERCHPWGALVTDEEYGAAPPPQRYEKETRQ